ncbi:MAG TPA: TonB-dependent receptor [Candidatus Acidoferrum sp.]|nr:TonB-dependent receptor [Candidatus Acidoferrum sp.]
MTKRRYIFLFVFAVVCLVPHFASAQSSKTQKKPDASQNQTQKVTLQGKVFDPDDRIVSGARVSLLAGLTPVEERETGADGQYRFENLAVGKYTLLANLAGFSTLSTGIELQPGETRTADLPLKVSALEEHVVVSASIGGALAPQIGSSVSVITQQEIADRGAESVLEVLRGLPGVEVNQGGRHGGATSVFIRGGNSDYNLVMIDGIQVNLFGGDFDFASLAADGVDHVEVSRGPQSALYGSNAVAGAVDIVSERGEGPPHFSFLAEGGSFTTRRFATGGSGLTRGFSWAYNLSRLDSGGVVPNDRYRNQSSYLSLGYSRTPKRQFTCHFFGNANDVGAPGPYGSDPDHLFPGIDTVSRDKQNLFAYQASYSEQFTSRLKQVFSVSVSPDRSFFHSPFGDSFLQNLRVVANSHGEVTVSSKDLLVYGFEYNHEQVRDTFIADAKNTPFVLPRASYAYFAENRWNPTSRLFLTTGLRVDDLRTDALPRDAFGSRPFLPANSAVKINPRVAVAYLLRSPKTGSWLGASRLHGSFGTGIRAPGGFDLAFTNNPKLKPEKSISFDAGIEQRLVNDRAVFDITYFYNRFKDQIVVLGGNLQNLSTFTSDNLANSRAQGVETSLRLRPFRSVEVAAEYTWLDSGIRALDGSTLVQTPFAVGQPLIRRPRSSAGYNITWRHKRLMVNTNAYIRGGVLDVEPNDGTFACSLGLPCLFRNGGYVLENAGFSYELPRGVEIHGRLNNFLNQKYEEALGFPALHLNFMTGIRFHFPAR